VDGDHVLVCEQNVIVGERVALEEEVRSESQCEDIGLLSEQELVDGETKQEKSGTAW
jgi:hypothetical protein